MRDYLYIPLLILLICVAGAVVSSCRHKAPPLIPALTPEENIDIVSSHAAALICGINDAKNNGDFDDGDPNADNADNAHALISPVEAILNPADTIARLNRHEVHFDSMPPGGIKLKINSLGAPLGRVFNDSNYLHIASAEAIGIKPMHNLADLWMQGEKLEALRTCEQYYLDNLTHSHPYLVPRAHCLLRDIGQAFRDSLAHRGGGHYRIKVTSVLRTPGLVKRLRRRNRNAVDTSAHLYGTTFDISYAKFICDSITPPRTQEDLKNLLGEVVEDMRRQGRCLVKYERRQGCFHITAR